jgi:hypothetical protein
LIIELPGTSESASQSKIVLAFKPTACQRPPDPALAKQWLYKLNRITALATKSI